MSEDEFNAAVEATRRGVQECMREYTRPAGALGRRMVMCQHCNVEIDAAAALAKRPNVPDWVSCPLCMREINLARAAAQALQDAAQEPPGMSQEQNGPAPSTAPTAAANGQSIYGLYASAAPAGWTPLRWLRHRELLGGDTAYGEQCADTDGTAAVVAEWDRPPQDGWEVLRGMARYMVADGHEDGLAALNAAIDNESLPPHYRQIWAMERAQRESDAARIATLEAKLNATMADAQSLQCQNESLQRQNEHWQAECRRLSALLVETREELARRMVLPSNALRHGGVR